MPPNVSVKIYNWVKFMKSFTLSKYISHKNEINVDNLTQD